MNNYWTARLALLTPFVMTGLLYIASFFLSKITKECFLWPSGKTLFDYAFLKKEHEIDQKYQKIVFSLMQKKLKKLFKLPIT